MRGAFGGIHMKEKYLVFYYEQKELLAYTVRGSFSGELEATKELLAYENGISTDAIRVTQETR